MSPQLLRWLLDEGDTFYLNKREHEQLIKEIDSVQLPPWKLSNIVERGRCATFGVTQHPKPGRIASMTPEQAILVKRINSALARKFQKTKVFIWSSLQVSKDAVYSPHKTP